MLNTLCCLRNTTYHADAMCLRYIHKSKIRKTLGKGIIKNRRILFWGTLGLMLVGCMGKPEGASGPKPEPVIDFTALTDFEGNPQDFSQVLLRIELLHTRADILKHGLSTPEEHQARLEYYRTQFREDVYLVSGIDTIPCYDAHAERLYMDMPYMHFILTFNHAVALGNELLIKDVIYSGQTLLTAIKPKTQLQ